MATESAAVSGAPASTASMDKGLKKGAIGYVSNIVIGVASTAPAYSLAATLGFIVAVKGVGVHAPGRAARRRSCRCCWSRSAYKYFNRADPDAGTTFAWTTRAFGPATGWLNGWAIFLADVIVMASLSDIAADLHLQAVRLHRTRRIQSGDHHRRGPVDRDHDLDLLPRHRALRAHPAGAARRRGADPRAVRGGRVGQGLRQQPAGDSIKPSLSTGSTRSR